MNSVLENSLYVKYNREYGKLTDISRKFMAGYSGNVIIRDNIFSIIANYARKKETELEIMRYPFHDKELWAFTFLKKGTVFVCVNTELEMSKQIFAAAHELYHIFCYAEDMEQNSIRNGSILDSDTADEAGKTKEDLEANAFAGLLLMPEPLLYEQMLLYGINKKDICMDDVLTLMDSFAMPYKAVILRLYECGCITKDKTNELLRMDNQVVYQRILLTGKAKRWQLDGKGQETFGSVMENFAYNAEHEFLVDSREEDDRAYLTKIKKQYGIG